MLHITIGLFLIALGVWGIFDEWYYVIDFFKGGSCALLMVGGLFGILAGLRSRPTALLAGGQPPPPISGCRMEETDDE